jgi:hypothetical protein
MSDDHEGTLGERLATRLAHIADAMEKGEPLKSTTVVRVVGDEAALRIIVRQQRAEIDRLQISARRIRGANKRLAAANVRLAAEVERLRITDAELVAISAAACACEDSGRTDIAVVVNAALGRLTEGRHANGGAA